MIVLGLQGQPRPERSFPADVRGAWDHGWYHDSAAVLLADGVVVAAVEEERLSRRKHSGKLPVKAAQACLSQAGLPPEAIDTIAFGEEGGRGRHRDPAITRFGLASVLRSEMPFLGQAADTVQLFEHHICHAISAFAPSGFPRSLVMTADGFGDGVSGYIAQAHGRQLELLESIAVQDSLGSFYSASLPLLGFGAHDEFKMMGLAPYGDVETLRELFVGSYRLLEGGRFEIDRSGLLQSLAQLGDPRRQDEAFSHRDRDIAAAAQAALERIVMHTLRHFSATTGQRSLCLAGGVMQNSSLTGVIARSGLFDQVFVQPASSDCGLALGAAYAGYLAAGGAESRIAKQTQVYLGPDLPSADAVERLLGGWSDLVMFETCPDIVHTVATLLADGMVLGWVQGRSEFGPRALGNRSILADPRPARNKEWVNEIVKGRESFRPFAPVVRAMDADRFFVLPPSADCAFMTFVVQVRPSGVEVLGATTHVDGTARVQVLQPGVNDRLSALLGAFGDLTGVPILLNTSFNSSFEPIVDSVDDAVSCLLNTGLDALVVGDLLVRKRSFSSDHILTLVPSLHEDECLASGPGPPDGTFHALLSPTGQCPISAAMYRMLHTGSRGRSALGERIHQATAADGSMTDSELAGELIGLWRRNLIKLRPAGRTV